ncbi:MAG: hypothetical protein EXQ56_12360 [Acidobacteria bacterium]|nr:hypothetical protein [Acidobacteriota bacterium]
MPILSRQRVLAIFFVALLVVLMTRLPLMPEQLYSFDSVNLALALDDFDPLRNQPQPPGYPFFVGEARLVNLLLINSPEQTFIVLQLIVATLTLGVMYLLGATMFSTSVGLVAAALLVVNPPFWYGGLTSSLRLHSALFSCLMAYLLWRALKPTLNNDSPDQAPPGTSGPTGQPETMSGEKLFLIASLVLGLAGGFRPVVELRLFPLWLFVGWRLGGLRVLRRGLWPLAAGTLAWVMVLVIDVGGPQRLFTAYSTYIYEQLYQTSALIDATTVASGGWRRMAGRVMLWTGMGALGWVWTLPGLWRRRAEWPEWKTMLYFLAIWFLPSLGFDLIVHAADPDHILVSVPALCLLGAAGLVMAEQRIPRWWRWLMDRGIAVWLFFSLGYPLWGLPEFLQPGVLALHASFALAAFFLLPRPAPAGPSAADPYRYRVPGPLVFPALVLNILFFFNFYRPPEPPMDLGLGRLRGLSDPLLMGTYETSYARVRLVDEITSTALREIAQLKLRDQRELGRPLLIVWTRDATPAWRKVAYYYPQDRVMVLEERGDPTAITTKARLWEGSNIVRQYTGGETVRIPLPRGTRIVWLVAGGNEAKLVQTVPVRKSKSIYYTDLPETPQSLRWGSFEFVAE